MKYIPLFILIQLVSLVLTIIGIPVCAYLSYVHGYTYDPNTKQCHWPSWAWVWDNQEDGVLPPWYRLRVGFAWSDAHAMFMWTAIRNSCNNLRYVPGVSKPGRPLWYWTNGTHYAKAGWEAKTGWPSLSAGSGRGF